MPLSSSSSASIRRSFIEYFQNEGHQHLPSSPLLPANDPSLLFTNAGMVQFKDIFLNHQPRPNPPRAVTSQRCVRAGGKHNDLENVGYTKRHHTFFEMLGNFSFADYGKQEAIEYAWKYLTEVLKISEKKLWVTVYKDDEQAEAIWLNHIGVDNKRFSYCGDADNFWSMSAIGPCGPCTEIFYDHGEHIAGGAPGSADADNDRYIEIWNLVFMQYERTADGEQNPLDKLSVDTGMGLERLSAVMQGVNDNYDTDLFQPLIAKAAELTHCEDLSSPSLKVIADHIRSASFLVTDGIVPSNEGRGYVLRRIIRRALRHGHKLKINQPFFYQLVDELAQQMGDSFPELCTSQAQVIETLRAEEEKFSETLDTGMVILEQTIADLSTSQLPGDVIFKLYDTYGFPTDLTADIARERGLTLDMDTFNTLMDEQKLRAKQRSGFSADAESMHKIEATDHQFSGYTNLQDTSTITAMFHDNQPVTTLGQGDKGIIVLNKTPFYAESGGQIGDSGTLQTTNAKFAVYDTKKQGIFHKHIGEIIEGTLSIGDKVQASVDNDRRLSIMRNHTATHLLHAALRKVLGDHVSQKGSLVAENRLRFDFSHSSSLEADEIKHIENLVNQQIDEDYEVTAELTTKDEAVAQGALALFGEKYADEVRVLTVGHFSKELCGGTHIERTGSIGDFKITAQSSVASGIRRIEAITGEYARRDTNNDKEIIRKLCELHNTNKNNLYATCSHMRDELKRLKKQIKSLAIDDTYTTSSRIEAITSEYAHRDLSDDKEIIRKLCELHNTSKNNLYAASSHMRDELKTLKKQIKQGSSPGSIHNNTLPKLLEQVIVVDKVKVLAVSVEDMPVDVMRSLIDQIKVELKTAVIVLGTVIDGRAKLLAGVTDNLTTYIRANELVNHIAKTYIDGKGGGRANMAEAGGNNPQALNEALAEVVKQVQTIEIA